MSANYPIHDLYIRELEAREVNDSSSLPLLQYDDHLLRQFGYSEFLRVSQGASVNPDVRQVADEVWTLIEGTVTLSWNDTRENSPTFKSEHQITTDKPTMVLVPFGVAFGFRVEEGEALFVRFSTHLPIDPRAEEAPMVEQGK